ncbi:MAG TPA: hypothetical protein PKK00_11055 [Bacteroidales bacterium]|nr:hypothetical protein [Bacteroidales bacterium]HPS17866.1 hypothetical protein [Bacteroidales bacterium]
MIKKIFNQNSFTLGLIIGIVAPCILYGIIYSIDLLIRNIFEMYVLLTPSTMQLTSIIVSILAMRYYLVKLKYEKTGKGLLLVTFIFIIAFFVNEYLIK